MRLMDAWWPCLSLPERGSQSDNFHRTRQDIALKLGSQAYIHTLYDISNQMTGWFSRCTNYQQQF